MIMDVSPRNRAATMSHAIFSQDHCIVDSLRLIGGTYGIDLSHETKEDIWDLDEKSVRVIIEQLFDELGLVEPTAEREKFFDSITLFSKTCALMYECERHNAQVNVCTHTVHEESVTQTQKMKTLIKSLGVEFTPVWIPHSTVCVWLHLLFICVKN